MWNTTLLVRTIDPRNVEHILKTNFQNYLKPENLRISGLQLLGEGIFRINHGRDSPEYDVWHKQRKVMSRIFFKDNFTGFLQTVFVRHARKLVDVLHGHAKQEEEVQQEGSTGTPPAAVDVQKLMFCFTLDTIAEIGFGVSMHSLKDPMPVAEHFDKSQARMERGVRGE